MNKHNNSHYKQRSAAVTISAIVWLFGQLALVSVLFFWPQANGFGWPQVMWSLDARHFAVVSPEINLGLDIFNFNLAIYVLASLAILAIAHIIISWQES